MISNDSVGKRISTLRKEKQLSQEQLAEQLNVSAQAVSKWENGKSLPETATLPALARILGHSIDSILVPQQLVILHALYTDGHEGYDVTRFVNQWVRGNALSLTVSEQTFPRPLNSDRIKWLLLKYEIPSGIYVTYVEQDNLLSLDIHKAGYTLPSGELTYIFAAYGNERHHQNVLRKMKHYQYFRWEQFTVNYELFPSLIENHGKDYLSLVYLSASDIHAISCPEGEALHYTPDRTRLVKSELSTDSYIIDNVERLRFGNKMDCSWAGALKASLTTMGIPTTYETVMGVSGACWRIAFTPVWDYSAVDALVAYDYASPAFQALGLEVSWADRITAEERKLEKQRIMSSIRAHRLPIAINLRVAPEWGVITGYMDNGDTLLCRSYFDEETFEEHRDDPEFQAYMEISKGYLNVDQWPFILIHMSRSGNTPSTSESFYTSLQVKLDSMNAPETRGYKQGYEGLEEWRSGLLDEDWYQQADAQALARRLGVNHFCLMSLADARRSAAVYLHQALSFIPPSSAGYLQEMADLYDRMYAALQQSYDSLAKPEAAETLQAPQQAWTREQRSRQALLLESVIALEKRGDELARIILKTRDASGSQMAESQL